MTNSLAKIIFVHGFLGDPSDWQETQKYLRLKLSNPFVTVTLWELAQKGADLKSLALQVSELCEPGSLVVGYSLGGRVLMHLPPEVFLKISGLVLISSHFGYTESEAHVAEKKIRKDLDKKWSQRFKSDDWSSVIKSWNDQLVFANATGDRPVRLEKNYDRAGLSQVLEACSLSGQENKIDDPTIPFDKTLFVHGEQDSKYSELIKIWQTQRPQMTVIKLSSGHDPLVSSAEALAESISAFYKRIITQD